jgi:sugar/nucleoside kinase (ribokinase family)
MLDRDLHDHLRSQYGDDHLLDRTDGNLLEHLVDRLCTWGAAIVVVKLGNHGLYLGTTGDRSRWEALIPVMPALAAVEWHARSVFAPCYQTNVAGTTGAGDATIAGFLLGLLELGSLRETLASALAVGACSVEQVDATSGIPSWEEVQRRLMAGWPQLPMRLSLPAWTFDAATGTYHGPSDGQSLHAENNQP